MSMNKLLNFVQGGSSKLPPGFRFQPTDDEIVYDYLISKTFSYQLPSSVVPEIANYGCDPWDLPGNEEQDKYFFTKKDTKYANGKRVNRTTQSGYWKATSGSDKRIKCPKKSRKNNNISGLRKTFSFRMGKSPDGYKTEWLLHEYRLVTSSEAGPSCYNVQNNSSNKNTLVQVGDWFLCHVFTKKRNTDDMAIDNAIQDDNFYDLKRKYLKDLSLASSSHSSSSSCGSSSNVDISSVRRN